MTTTVSPSRASPVCTMLLSFIPACGRCEPCARGRMRPLDAIRHIKARHPKTRILALSGTDDLGLAEQALRAGADGFLPKTARPEALAGPLWTIAEGLRVIDGALLDALLSNTRKPPSALLDSLSAQDLRLWTLLATGMETGDIARRMLVSERTAKRMVAVLLHKLGVSNRIAAAALAGSFRLLDDVAETDRLS